MRKAYIMVVRKPEGTHLQNSGVSELKILGRILRAEILLPSQKLVMDFKGCQLDSSGLDIVVGSLGSIKV
jgi:hypothetical protein